MADKWGKYPIDIIIKSGEPSLALMLIRLYKEVNVLLLVRKAIWNDSIEIAKKLLDKYEKDTKAKSIEEDTQANVIEKDTEAKSIEKDTQANDKEYLNTILHDAVCHNCPEIVKRVLKYGADPNIQHKNGRTVLHMAISLNCFGEPQINDRRLLISLLLEYKASPNIQDTDGATPLHEALYYKRMDIVRSLLNYGANPNIQSKDGIAPLHMAVDENNLEIVELLLEKNANPNIQSKNGITALYIAVDGNNLEIVEALLKKGATSLGPKFEKVYDFFQQSWKDIQSQIRQYINSSVDNPNGLEYLIRDITKVIKYIYSLKNIPGKYNFFKSENFKHKLLDNVINELREEDCEYKGHLLFHWKYKNEDDKDAQKKAREIVQKCFNKIKPLIEVI